MAIYAGSFTGVNMPIFDRRKWDAKYAEVAAGTGGDANHGIEAPSQMLLSLSDWLPTRGRALDLAGGAGRHAIWLAQRGLDVTLADISACGLQLASDRAAREGVTINCLNIDLEEEPFPAGPWDLILSVCYLHRPLFPAIEEHLAPHGRLMVIQPTTLNLERHSKPPAPFLLQPGELPTLVPNLRILHHTEAWLADGRHDAVLVASR
jgi:tellurite methyltransferase